LDKYEEHSHPKCLRGTGNKGKHNCRQESKELKENEAQIKKVIRAEEEKFQETINQGLNILDEYIEEMKEAGSEVFGGDKAFKLYDTFFVGVSDQPCTLIQA